MHDNDKCYIAERDDKTYHVILKFSQLRFCRCTVVANFYLGFYINARRMMNEKKDENEDVLDLVDAVYEYLTKAQYPMDCTATKKRQIRKKAEKFRIDGGKLIYIANNGKVCILLYIKLYQ